MSAESIVFRVIFRERIIELYLSPPHAARGPLWRRRSLLLALAGLHVLAFLLWPAPGRPPTPAADAQRRITWLTLPAPRHVPPLARATPRLRPSEPATAEPQPPKMLEQPRVPQAITLPQPAGTPATLPADPFAVAPAVPAADDLKTALRKSAGAADRQLRKESRNPRDKFVANADTALARGMDAAFQGDHGYGAELLIPPDGRLTTKVRSGGSTYCAAMQSNTLMGGRDVFRDGVKTEITNCPQLHSSSTK